MQAKGLTAGGHSTKLMMAAMTTILPQLAVAERMRAQRGV